MIESVLALVIATLALAAIPILFRWASPPIKRRAVRRRPGYGPVGTLHQLRLHEGPGQRRRAA